MSEKQDGTGLVATEAAVDCATGAAIGAWRNSPVGCTGSSEEVTEIVRLLAALASNASAAPERLTSGYALTLAASPELTQLAREFITRESACCPFLQLQLDRDGKDLRLQVSGPENAQTALDLSFELCRVAQAGRLG